MPFCLRAYDLETGLALFQVLDGENFGILEEVLPGYWEERPLDRVRILRVTLSPDLGLTHVFKHVRDIKAYLHSVRFMSLDERLLIKHQ